MTWEWSHSGEAYSNVLENLYRLDKKTLIECLAEFREKELSDFDEDRIEFGPDYDRYVKELSSDRFHTVETLVDMLWPKVEGLALCTTGGFMAHLCPYGCLCHMVSFDLENDPDE